MTFGFALAIAIISAAWTLLGIYSAYMTTTGLIRESDAIVPILLGAGSLTATTVAWLTEERNRRRFVPYLLPYAVALIPLLLLGVEVGRQRSGQTRTRAQSRKPTPEEVAGRVYSLIGGTPAGPDQWTRYPHVRFRGTVGPVVWAQGTVDSKEEYESLRRELLESLRVETGSYTPQELRVFISVVDPSAPDMRRKWAWDTASGNLWVACLDGGAVATFAEPRLVPTEIPCREKHQP